MAGGALVAVLCASASGQMHHSPRSPADEPSPVDERTAGQPQRVNPDLPVITEVLYAVPQGQAGDASGDGVRDATGDEFVELFNPGNKTIRLTGWTLTDRNPPDAGQFLFVFPSFALKPGEVVVVFNGLNQSIPGPVGTAQKPPTKRNEHFHGAWVFTAGNTSSGVGFANSGDWVSLRTPASEVVSLVMWGKPSRQPQASASVIEKVPKTSRSSVQRTIGRAGVAFEAHPTVDGLRFSPGLAPPRSTELADGSNGASETASDDRHSDASEDRPRVDRP